MRILVVEDEQDLASAMAISLRRDGYAVDWAPDTSSAVERVDVNEYDVNDDRLVVARGASSLGGTARRHVRLHPARGP